MELNSDPLNMMRKNRLRLEEDIRLHVVFQTEISLEKNVLYCTIYNFFF